MKPRRLRHFACTRKEIFIIKKYKMTKLPCHDKRKCTDNSVIKCEISGLFEKNPLKLRILAPLFPRLQEEGEQEKKKREKVAERERMKHCELCGLRATMHCESDQASLCWDCDEKVHGANFLVAKHTRSLLCHVCHCPTPWKASGPKLTPTVSVCESCVDCHGRRFERGRDDESQGGNDEDEDDRDEYEIDDVDSLSVDGDDGDFGDEDEDGENQVVPWSSSSPPPPPTAAAAYSSTTSEEKEEEERISVSKRMREDADLDSDDEATSSGSFKSVKRRRVSEDYRSVRNQDVDGQTESSRSTAIITSLHRLTKDAITDADSASATILGICKLSKDQSR